MAIIKSKTPFNGYRANVLFVNGLGETNDQHLVNWFKDHGYEVEESSTKTIHPAIDRFVADETVKIEERDREIPLEEMTLDAIKEYAKEHGVGYVIGKTRDKEKLINNIRKNLTDKDGECDDRVDEN